MGANFVRFNTEEFPQKVKLELHMGLGVWGGSIIFTDRREFDLAEIKVIWNRRPHKPEIDPRVEDEPLRQWAENEADQTLQILWALLADRFWLNKVEPNNRVQFDKWLQMRTATKLGLITPHSLITNNPEIAASFIRSEGNSALKVVRHGVIRYSDGRVTAITTKRLSPESEAVRNIGNVSLTPIFLQNYVEKKLELRITVVEKKVFACEIHSQQNQNSMEDWRGHIFGQEKPIHKPCTLPSEIETKCVKLLEELDLTFGCIDMILTPKGEYVFLEVNANGQWGWIEQLTNMPVSKGIAELLASHDS